MTTTRMMMMFLPWRHREFTFDVDVTQLPCGLNGALYFVEMDEDGGKGKFPTNKVGLVYLCVCRCGFLCVSLFANCEYNLKGLFINLTNFVHMVNFVFIRLTKYSHTKDLRPEPRSALVTATLNVPLISSSSTARPTAWTGLVTPMYICCPATMINVIITLFISILIRELRELRNWSLWILLRGT